MSNRPLIRTILQFLRESPDFDKFWEQVTWRVLNAKLASENGSWTLHERPPSFTHEAATEIIGGVAERTAGWLIGEAGGEFVGLAKTACDVVAVLRDVANEKTLHDRRPAGEAKRFNIKLWLVLDDMVGPVRSVDVFRQYHEYSAIQRRFYQERDREMRRKGLLDDSPRIGPR